MVVCFINKVAMLAGQSENELASMDFRFCVAWLNCGLNCLTLAMPVLVVQIVVVLVLVPMLMVVEVPVPVLIVLVVAC